jgi:hypothetical protein
MTDKVNSINSTIKDLNDSINNNFNPEEIDKYFCKNIYSINIDDMFLNAIARCLNQSKTNTSAEVGVFINLTQQYDIYFTANKVDQALTVKKNILNDFFKCRDNSLLDSIKKFKELVKNKIISLEQEALDNHAQYESNVNKNNLNKDTVKFCAEIKKIKINY